MSATQRLPSSSSAGPEIHPLSPALGARVQGVDASRPLPAATLKRLLEAWHAHGVLYLPNQSLDELEQVRFGENFGELATTQGEYAISKGHPAIMYITNEKQDGQYIGALPDGEMFFHSDMCYVEKPSMATMLYAMSIPKTGGNTLFANMYKAFDALPAATRQHLAGLKAVNSYEPGTSAPTAAMRLSSSRASDQVRSYAQPVVCTHPVTGRKALYVNRLMTEYIVGMPREESDALLESLFDHQEQPEFIYEHTWTPGDLLIWDNRCMLHARGDFDASELRKLRRITVKGERIS
ncbi:TauD/TfdA family dioxygenase [Pigmentiphaga sp. GD03639]|uniref:TauD/TfdA family dioxygenase n=1 Tax=Pigmentiphaga daeguensis TaxID=414049 RepID=A0ABN1CVN7_9BURK|nr:MULTISPECIES: TauD/TfdA family dioxygenase [unclassified Pigmentiphaga]MDH2235652.1 TauD/TfdA family dioxygenase [Pigmentiphaga sp. GD03639]